MIKLKNGKYRVFCKGAAEMVLGLCTKRIKADGSTEMLNDKSAENQMIEGMAREALRTIVLAYKDCDTELEALEDVEKDLTMIGLVGIEDPVRFSNHVIDVRGGRLAMEALKLQARP